MNFHRTANLGWRRVCRLIGLVFVVGGGISEGHAAQTISTDKIDVSLIAERRIAIGIQPTPRYYFVPANHITQGETLFYTLRVHNTSNKPVPNVVVVQSVPMNTRYLYGTASGAGAVMSFSADNGNTFTLQPTAEAVYTHIRWQWEYPLPPGAMVYARFRAVFE